MKLAFSTNAYLKFPFAEAVRRLAAIGYAGVEIMADVPHAWPAYLLPEQKQAIRDALRQPQEGETRVSAALTRIECGPKGLVFVLKTGDRTLRLAAAGFGGLHLVNFNREADTQLTCGARKSETPSVVTYRAAADARAKTDGSLVALEFVPADFQLLQ